MIQMNKFDIAIFILFLTLCLIGGIGFGIHLGKQKNQPQEILQNDSTIDEELCFEYICKMRIKHPKVVLAQAIQESRFNSKVFKENNNLFGMKKPYQRVATVSSKHGGQYKYYDNWQQCITDYALWQIQQESCWLDDTTYMEFLANKYAEDPNYYTSLVTIYNSLNYE